MRLSGILHNRCDVVSLVLFSTLLSRLSQTVAAAEVLSMLRLLSKYEAHLRDTPESLLCRFFGCFSVKVWSSRRRCIRGPPRRASSAALSQMNLAGTSRVFFVLMGNTLAIPRLPPDAEVFDLKGAHVDPYCRRG